jgi:DNA polymerase III alpha subunit|tara:strand:+ start:807 stop:1331 length:525 start_codon:yes stop_codon:yes gene_type:complete
MKTDSLGIPRFSNKDLVDMIYSGHVDKCHVVLCDKTDEIDKFNNAMKQEGLSELSTYIPLDVDKKTFDGALQSEWFMPDKYKDINVYEYVLGKAETPCPQHVQDRIWEEMEAYKERDMHNLLRYMIYLVDFMRENNIVWGVGRGSSVASYVLYVIGVHRVNSIQFELDWREFLR